MEKEEIQEKIDKLNKEIGDLELRKQLYENMNEIINQAISKLTKAKEYISSAGQEFKKNYRSQTASEKIKEIDNEGANISKIIKELKLDILATSNNDINSINTNINNKKNQITMLKQELNSIQD